MALLLSHPWQTGILTFVETDRRDFLKYLTAATVMAAPILAGPQGATEMYGLIAKLTSAPGKRAELIRILRESANNMPGCLSYVVAKDSVDENILWVTEVWDSVASHDASLSLPSVRNAIAQGKAVMAGFDKVAVTTPVWGVGLPAAHE
jgi:quinol monooxygenase YgiN